MIKYIANTTDMVKFDTDTEKLSVQKVVREGIRNVYLISDPGVVITEDEKEINVKSGDIVITFWEDRFPNKTIVVKSKDWKNNIKTYEEERQREKEEWAKKNTSCNDLCEACPCDSAN